MPFRHLLLCLLATACTVGPDYALPETPFPSHWLSAPASEDSSAKASEQAWWKQLRDPALDELIAKAMQGNIDLQVAQSRIDQSRAQIQAAMSALLPLGNLSATSERQANRIAFPGPINLSKPFNTFQTGFDASWELDLFGKSRREIESREATLEASEASAADMRVSLLAEVARTYIDIRQYQAQLALAESTLNAYDRTAGIAKKRYKSGEIAGLDVTQAQAQSEQAKAQIPYYQNLIQSAELSMDVLLGEQPGATHAITAAPAPIPTPEPELVLNTPAKAIAARPDIRISERNLASATAQRGVAIAQFFPDISLSGFAGLLNVDAGNLAQGGSKSWSGRGNILLPILNYGTLSANLETASAKQREALATYRKNIIAALSDVERALSAYTRQQETRAALRDAQTHTARAAAIAQKRYKAGLSSYLEVLDAQRTQYASQQQLAEADANYARSIIAVHKSLGGGWEAKTAPLPETAPEEPETTPLLGKTELPTRHE